MKKFFKTALRMTPSRYLVLILISGFLIIGCQDELSIQEPTADSSLSQNDDKYHVENGILVFKDRESFNTTVSELANLSFLEYVKWAEVTGLEFQYYALSRIWNDNDKYDEYLFNHQIENPEREFSELYYSYLERGLIREYIEEGEVSFELTTATPYLANILNIDGFFKVGDTLVQVTDELIKFWDKGSVENFDHLKSSTVLNIREGIEIWKLRQSESKTLKSTIYDFSSFSPSNPITTGWIYSSKRGRRLEFKVYFRSWEVVNYDYYDAHKYFYEHWWSHRSQQKNWLGKWKDYSYNKTISGSWNARVTLLNDYTLGSEYLYYNIQDYTWTTSHPYGGYSVGLHNKEHGLQGSPFETWITGGGMNEKRTIQDIDILNANWQIESFVNGNISYP